jgi:hypothetical protein
MKTLEDAFARAAKIAEAAPKALREIAFQRALDALLGKTTAAQEENKSGKKSKNSSGKQRTAKADSSEKDVSTLLSKIKSPEHPEVKNAQNVLHRSLIILKIAYEDHDIDGLTANDVAKITKEKFRIPTSRQAVDYALNNRSDLVDKANTKYRIMAPGMNYIDNPENLDAKKKGPAKRKPAKKEGNEGKKTAPEKTKTARKTAAKKTSARPGPTQAIKSLLTDGFFSTPKEIGEMITELKDNYATTYKSTEVSPTLIRMIKNKELNRSKNDGGKYVYKSA